MKIKKHLKGLLIELEFTTQKELAEHFIRFQEHYESPEFMGKIFTLGQMKDWYARTEGAFTYYDDWDGFNIPSDILDPFIKGLFDPLTKEEQRIVELFRYRTDKFYIIGTWKCPGMDKEVFPHEVTHAMFYIDKGYRDKVNKVINKHTVKSRSLFKTILKLGYHERVLSDEVNAYVTTSPVFIKKKGASYPQKLEDELIKLREEYVAKLS